MKKRNWLTLCMAAVLMVVCIAPAAPALGAGGSLQYQPATAMQASIFDGVDFGEFGQDPRGTDSSSGFSGGLGGARNGSVTYSSARQLEDQAHNVLMDFMTCYYNSLANLSVVDPSYLFADSSQAMYDRTAWEIVAGMRQLQPMDLSMSGYSFSFNVYRITERANGDLFVEGIENTTMNFRAYPNVDSKNLNLYHSFTLTRTFDGWRIANHMQDDSTTYTLLGNRTGAQLTQRRDELLSYARTATDYRYTRGTNYTAPTVDHGYNRSDAVNYARSWVGRRNPSWRVYDDLGGNCQNFTSQAMYAGGIPMDYIAPGQWKWYGNSVNNSGYAAVGRSSSWSGVNEFLSYVNTNSGFGMVAYSDAAYGTGEAGDVIHLGLSDGWKHTVMITNVVQAGGVTDYLVCSNTLDLIDFPVSAYYYPNHMLIKIYGWNEMPAQEQPVDDEPEQIVVDGFVIPVFGG